MPVTLAQAKVGMADKIDQRVIDMFRRDSFILDAITFDNVVSPGTGGSTLTYGYTQLKTPSTAQGRAINGEYTAGEAERTTKSVNLKIMGGAFEVDRVLEDTAAKSEIAFQLQQKTKAVSNKFHNDFINGSSTAKGDNTSFDGLKKLLKGASTECTPDVAIDLSTSAKCKENADEFVYQLDTFLGTLSERPQMLLMNSKALSAVKTVARHLGYFSQDEDAFGRKVDTYDGIQLRDMGQYYNGTKTVDIIDTNDTDGTTDIYAVTFAMDACHGASPTGNKVIKTYMPNMSLPGAVKKGEVELVSAIVLKDTTKCGVLHKVQVKPAS